MYILYILPSELLRIYSYYDSLLKITNIANETNIVFVDEAIEALRTEYKRILKAS